MNPSPGHRRLIELIDACRADSDDLSLPEMADLRTALRRDDALRQEWDARQRSERVVREAMHDVQVPAGLAERILAAAAARDRERLSAAVESAAAEDASSQDVQLPVGAAAASRFTRRRWMALAASAAAALVAAIVWQFWPGAPEKVSRAQLASEAQEWFGQAIAQRGAWQSNVAIAPLPFPTQAITAMPSGWQPLRGASEPQLAAFDLTSLRSGGSAVLFVAKTRRKHALGSLPYTRLNASGGLEMGAWQVGDVLYVLVVDRKHSQQRLDDFIRPQRLALAR